MPPYHAKKRMGQHFLCSTDIISRICDLVALTHSCDVVEIGPGKGELTLPIAKTGVRLVAVEFDRDLIAPLTQLLRDCPNSQVIKADFLTFVPTDFGLDRFTLVGNLPYNITSPVIEWCTNHVDQIVSGLFMVQKEMALRLASSPGGHDWSPIAIFTQLCFEVELCFDVSPSSFEPRPKVKSSVIRLKPKPRITVENPVLFERVVRASFRQRRKLLTNNLVPGVFESVSQAKAMCAALSLAERCRAEQVSIEQFMRITDYVANLRQAR